MLQAQIVYLTNQQKVVTLPLPLHGATVGRAAGCTIVTTDSQVSQQHALFKLSRDIWHIEDQHSTNGTMVNGSRITAPTGLRHMDVISCGSLQLRFMLVAGSQQATLAERGASASTEPANDFTTLRSELSKLKKERDDLLETLEQECRALAGANAENRQLRQGHEELRSQHTALRKQHEHALASHAAVQEAACAAAAEKAGQSKQLSELLGQMRALRTDLESQAEARKQAEQEARRLKERVAALEMERDSLARDKGDLVGVANQRQSEIEALRRMHGDWERYKEQRDADLLVSAVRIKDLLATIADQEAALRPLQKELAYLRQRYDEKNAQHRGLRSEFDKLNAELERHREQSKRQIERLAKDKEAIHGQLQTLQREAEQTQKAANRELSNRALAQLAAEVNQAHQALVRENEAIGQGLTLALRWHLTASQTSPADPTALRVRDAIEKSRSHGEQSNNLLQQLEASCAQLAAQIPKFAH